jgi:peroxiredoxin
LRDEHERFAERGARVVAIGMGATETARRFKEEYSLPFPVLVDKKRESYRLLDLKQGSVMEVMGPSVWMKGAKSVLKHGQGMAKENPLQLGGVVIIKNGEAVLVHRSETSSDNAPIETLLEAL